MLPAGARLRHRNEFVATMRAGRRRSGLGGKATTTGAGAALLVTHLVIGGEGDEVAARAGFVVPRGVGAAVVRNRVRRRLRHLVAPRLATLPSGSRLVVRALPAAASASFCQLDHALDQALTAPVRRT